MTQWIRTENKLLDRKHDLRLTDSRVRQSIKTMVDTLWCWNWNKLWPISLDTEMIYYQLWDNADQCQWKSKHKDTGKDLACTTHQENKGFVIMDVLEHRLNCVSIPESQRTSFFLNCTFSHIREVWFKLHMLCLPLPSPDVLIWHGALGTKDLWTQLDKKQAGVS